MNTTLPPPVSTAPPPPPPTGPASPPRGRAGLLRPRDGRVLGGVCAALADRYGWNPTTTRVLSVVSILLPGPQVLLYLGLWIVVPSEEA